MKKGIILIAIVVAITTSWGCNNKADKEKKGADKVQIEEHCPGTANMTIEKPQADEMRKKYYEEYINKIPAPAGGKLLVKSIWIDSVVISAFANFLDKYPDADGVRFINSQKVTADDNTLILVPTAKGGQKDTHKNLWSSSAKITFPAGSPEPVFKDYNYGYSKTMEYEDLFENNYRRSKATDGGEIDSLSKRVWIAKCVFENLRSIIRDKTYGKEIDGVRVYFGAYEGFNTQYPVIGQIYPNQSTILLVPTNPLFGSPSADDWEAVPKTTNFVSSKAYNHGQICPNSCE